LGKMISSIDDNGMEIDGEPYPVNDLEDNF
jgi:hypothetical protein